MKLPKYQIIINALTDELNAKEFSEGDRFYSENEIKQRFNVSSITAVKAINELVTLGLVYRIQGKGTFVSKRRTRELVRYTERDLSATKSESVSWLEVKACKDSHVIDKFEEKYQESIIEIHRLRFGDGIPTNYQVSYIPKEIVSEDFLTNFKNYESLYHAIKNHSGFDFYRLSFQEALYVESVDLEYIYKRLELENKTLLSMSYRHTYFSDKTVAEYVVNYKNPKFFNIEIESFE